MKIQTRRILETLGKNLVKNETTEEVYLHTIIGFNKNNFVKVEIFFFFDFKKYLIVKNLMYFI